MIKIVAVVAFVVAAWLVVWWLDRRMKRPTAEDRKHLAELVGESVLGGLYLVAELELALALVWEPSPTQHEERLRAWWGFSAWDRNRLEVELKWVVNVSGWLYFTDAGEAAVRDYVQERRATPEHSNCRCTIISSPTDGPGPGSRTSPGRGK